jgi:hypothetical protein
MSISFQAKESRVLSRQLAVQEISAVCNIVAATSDVPSVASIDNSTIADSVITLDIGEAIASCICVQVINRATGAVVALEGAPSLAVANKISVQVDGTGLSSVAVIAKYKVQE